MEEAHHPEPNGAHQAIRTWANTRLEHVDLLWKSTSFKVCASLAARKMAHVEKRMTAMITVDKWQLLVGRFR